MFPHQMSPDFLYFIPFLGVGVECYRRAYVFFRSLLMDRGPFGFFSFHRLSWLINAQQFLPCPIRSAWIQRSFL